MTAEEFQAKVQSAAAAFGASGISEQLEGDDQLDVNVCLLVPESCVSTLIGKSGANITAIKAASGANVSFAKKEKSSHGLRKCFHTGSFSAVRKAVFVSVVLVGETQAATGSAIEAGVLVSIKAAGSVIGKGGENLKNLREQTGCTVNLEKQQEANPTFGGRSLKLSHAESAATVCQAIYSVMRLPGFESLTAQENHDLSNTKTASQGSYGPASSSPHGKDRYSPYGVSGDICAIHGKKRSMRSMQPSATTHGQFVCLDDDQCKGATVADMDAMRGAHVNQIGQMGQQMYNPYMPQASNVNMSTVCAIHNKTRGARNLQPHPTQPGLFICLEADRCKVPAGEGAEDPTTHCATHGKKRGARNLQAHPTTAGLFVCLDTDACKQ